VPKLDIVTPHVLNRKIRRKRDGLGEEVQSSTKTKNKPSKMAGSRKTRAEDWEKIIKLSGLGRQFQLSLSLNRNLINRRNNDFVHLFRHENHSEILADDIVESQLHCFYQGSAVHYNYNSSSPPSHDDDEREIRTGVVAVDLCNGLVSPQLKAFMLIFIPTLCLYILKRLYVFEIISIPTLSFHFLLRFRFLYQYLYVDMRKMIIQA
jgi:hypothetical protein